jgi:subtilisin
VQTSHPFVRAAVVAEACYSTQNPSAYEYSLCPGRVIASTATGSAAYCYDANFGNWACDHGTHVAGIAAGRGDNQTFAGVAKGGNLFPIQVFTRDAYYDDSFAYFSDINRGLQRVIDLHDAGVKIAAVNLSLGGGAYTSQGTCDSANLSTNALIDNLKSRGIATVIAAGNESYTKAISAPCRRLLDPAEGRQAGCFSGCHRGGAEEYRPGHQRLSRHQHRQTTH